MNKLLTAIASLMLSVPALAQNQAVTGGAAVNGPALGLAVPALTSLPNTTLATYLYAADPPYSISTASTDNGPALNTFFAACAAQNTTCVLPSGIFEVQTALVINTTATVASGQTATGASVTVIGSGSGPGQFNPSINTTGNGTYLYWGAGTSSGPMLSILGIAKVVFKNFALSGSHIAQDVVWVNQGSATGNLGPYGYDFEDMVFTNAASGYAAFEIGGTQNTARFHFLRDYFDTNTGSIGYRSNVNYNALDMLFESCAFGGMGPSNQGTYGFQMNAGSATIIRAEFGLNSTADIDLTGGGGLTLIDPYTEQSKRFLVSPDSYNNAPLTIIGGDINSYPYSYWKAGYGSQPANNADQYAAIVYNHSNAPLVLIDTEFIDPSNGTWAVTMTGLGVQQQQSGVVAPYQWNNIGSIAATGAVGAFTSTVFYDINTNPILNYSIGTQQLQSIDYVANSGGRAVNTGTTADTLAAGIASTYESANTGSGAFTVTLAAPAQDGERRRICFKNLTGTITWTATSPATATAGFPTTIAAGTCFEMTYNAVSATPTNAPATTWLPY